ncbi:hypothetical protein SAMN05444487_10253 [Marininema mesophilum]|uniref:DUF5668 domain-containing protein n=1 Tax=Marininema mesophilum TaxID=1048340 RepID=A0A1H2RZ36_9BACL|nr:hypothetical protein [Marininema mesophilum]SDW24713.1 hypothetical protein SAMN05444487_10253 [Marininema mesophilum]
MRGKIMGLFIIAAGTLLLLRQLGWSIAQTISNWEFLLVIAGFILLILAMRKPVRPRLSIVAMTLIGLGIHAWGLAQIEKWPDHWSLFPIIIGASFLLMGGLYQKNRFYGVIGTLLCLLGLFAWPGVGGIPGLEDLEQTLNTYWPILLISLGLILFIRKK